MPWLITAEQLDKFRKHTKALIILDASWHHASDSRDAKKEFLQKHIIGAQFFDIDAFSEANTDLPHMLTRDEKLIAEKLANMGIKNDCKIIIYDNSDLHTACRALWMFKVFGHNPQQLYVLNGGIAAWEKYGGKTEEGEPKTNPKSYNVRYQPQLVRDLAQMKKNLQEKIEQVIDARGPVRFVGGAEPRSGLRQGHIPESFNLPFAALFAKDGRWLSAEKIREVFLGVKVDLTKPIVASCGSGMTAAVIDFALDLLNHKQHALYDGSWTEWGADKPYPGEASLDERPVETSLEEEPEEKISFAERTV